MSGGKTTAAPADPKAFARRLWTYQRERFPVLSHGLLIGAFAGSAVCVSALSRASTASPGAAAFGTAFIVLFLAFAQLRIADEHKDFEADAAFRPERAVPRGLVSLRELRGLALASVALQAVVVMAFHPPLLALLTVVWLWMALMSMEFFVPSWLKRQPLPYLVSHMLVMPLFGLLASACDWLPARGHDERLVGAIAAFVALSFANGAVIEIARKCRAPEAERSGVETYSQLWGHKAAGRTVGALLLLATLLALGVWHYSSATGAFALALMASCVYPVALALRYARSPSLRNAQRLEVSAGLFVLANYLLIGPLPLGLRSWTA